MLAKAEETGIGERLAGMRQLHRSFRAAIKLGEDISAGVQLRGMRLCSQLFLSMPSIYSNDVFSKIHHY